MKYIFLSLANLTFPTDKLKINCLSFVYSLCCCTQNTKPSTFNPLSFHSKCKFHFICALTNENVSPMNQLIKCLIRNGLFVFVHLLMGIFHCPLSAFHTQHTHTQSWNWISINSITINWRKSWDGRLYERYEKYNRVQIALHCTRKLSLNYEIEIIISLSCFSRYHLSNFIDNGCRTKWCLSVCSSCQQRNSADKKLRNTVVDIHTCPVFDCALFYVFPSIPLLVRNDFA